jgi:hypothetical protein
VVSPNGTWQLNVKPGNRIAEGSALTTLTNKKTGEIAWKQMLPYTFWQCCVNEKGIVAGYAYTKGAKGEVNKEDPGLFLISFLDVSGELMHQERTKQVQEWIGMGYNMPAYWAKHLYLDGENDRMILLMPGGVLRTYNMRTGTLERAFLPGSKGDASAYEWLDEIHFIPNTKLMLLQSNSAGGNSEETKVKSCIQLIDEGGKTLWAVSQSKVFGAEKEWPYPEFHILKAEKIVNNDPMPDPFVDPFMDPFADDPREAGDEAPEFQMTPEPEQVSGFEIYLGDTEEKVVLHVLDASKDDGDLVYEIKEISREKWKLPKKSTVYDNDSPPENFPVARTKQLASFQLKNQDGTSLSDIAAVTIGTDGKIYALDRKQAVINAYDSKGIFLRVFKPDKKYKLDISYHSACIAVDYKGEIFVRTANDYGIDDDKKDPFAGHFLRFSADGTLKEKTLKPPASEFSDRIFAQPLTDYLIFSGYGDGVSVTRRDKYGSQFTSLTHRHNGQWLERIKDVAFAPDGSIAVKDSSLGDSSGGFTTPFSRLPNHLPAETITIYTPEGKSIRTIDFNGYELLSEIAFDDKHIIATYPYHPATPLIYVFDSMGRPIGAVKIDELKNKERVDLRSYIIANGKEVLAIDKESGRVFRYEMPSAK